MNRHHLQKFLPVERFRCLRINTKHPIYFCLYHQLSFLFGSFISCLRSGKRYTSLRLQDSLILARLGVELVVFPDVLSTGCVRTQEKAFSEISFLLPDPRTER
jgi:hypothetical protein